MLGFLENNASTKVPGRSAIVWTFEYTLYREELGKDGRFWYRLGNIQGSSVLDLSGCKDGIVTFNSEGSAFPIMIVPFMIPLQDNIGDLCPKKGSEIYVLNSKRERKKSPGIYDWNGFFQSGNIHAGVHIGKHYIGDNRAYNLAHLFLIYSDVANPTFSSCSADWDYRVLETNEFNKMETFTQYTCISGINRLEIYSSVEHVAARSLADREPFKIKGKIRTALNISNIGLRTLEDQDYLSILTEKILCLSYGPSWDKDVRSIISAPRIKANFFF